MTRLTLPDRTASGALSGPHSIDSPGLREVFAHLPAGVSVVTTMSAAGMSGMTASAVCCVSLDPPLLLVCLHNRSATLSQIRRQGRFAVNVLRDRHVELADAFARPAVDKASKENWVDHRIVQDVPILTDALGWLACRVWATYPGGDHTIVVGVVRDLRCDDGAPLVRHNGRYRSLAPVDLSHRQDQGDSR